MCLAGGQPRRGTRTLLAAEPEVTSFTPGDVHLKTKRSAAETPVAADIHGLLANMLMISVCVCECVCTVRVCAFVAV